MSSPSRSLLITTLREKKKREDLLARMEACSFPRQWAFITDPARLKAALTSRRAGKSYGDALYLLKEATQFPGSSCVYAGKTCDSAIRIMWKDCLRKLGKLLDLNMKFNKKDSAIYLPDHGSVIYLVGVDANEDEMQKIYGQKYRLAIVDEAAVYRQDVRALAMDVLFPAVADYGGSVCLTGMPCNNVNSFFFDVTTGAEAGWSVHRWTAFDNPYMAEKMKAHLDYLMKINPGVENTPTFRQHYRGEWVLDSENLIYKFDKEKNFFERLPEAAKWHYVLGIDLGYDPDPSAFVVLAYRDYDPTLYVVEAYKRARMTISEVALRIKMYEKSYNGIGTRVIDNANKQAVEEIKQRYGIALVPADKAGKSDFIALCNDDLARGRVLVKTTGCEPLVEEMCTLSWDEKMLLKGVLQEPKRAKNHCCDAFLYGWRWAFNWVDRGEPVNIIDSVEGQVDAFWEREAREAGSSSEYELIERAYGIS